MKEVFFYDYFKVKDLHDVIHEKDDEIKHLKE
jgi:hypothetical protein